MKPRSNKEVVNAHRTARAAFFRAIAEDALRWLHKAGGFISWR